MLYFFRADLRTFAALYLFRELRVRLGSDTNGRIYVPFSPLPTTLLTPPVPPTEPQFFRHLRAAKNYQLGRRRRKLTCPCLSRAGVSSGIYGGDEMLWSRATTGRHAIKPFLGSPLPLARKCLFPRYN